MTISTTARIGAAAAAAFLAFGLTAAGGVAPRAAAQLDLDVRIELTELSPRVVTADGPGVLTVAGTITNHSDRTIDDLDVRVQRGEPLRAEADLAAALSGDAVTDTARPRFVDVPHTLGPGGSAPLRVQVPLRGGGPLDSLQIAEAGVYPLLVNVNGLPDFGGRARLAAADLLLPVLGLPAQDAMPAVPAAPLPDRTPLTMLWPLVDVPDRLPDRLPIGGQAAAGTPVTLGDDSLAVSLAPGGRLHGLVQAALEAAPEGSPLARAMCVAVDPDLVDTVRLMAEVGYLLPNGTAGTGQQAAADWLRDVRELVAGRCVLALPMADIDLVALSRAGLTDLQGRARTDGAQIVREVLQAEPITELAWPAGEVLDARTLTDLASLGVNGVLVEPGGLTDGAQHAGQPIVGLATGAPATASLRGVLVDPMVGRALAEPSSDTGPASDGSGGTPAQPSQERNETLAGAPDQASYQTLNPSTLDTGEPLATQDGLAALAFRVATRGQSGVLLAPPRRWSVGADEATALLSLAGRLLTTGWAQPRELGTLVGGVPPQTTATLGYPGTAAGVEIPRSVTALAGALRDQVRDVESATRRDPRGGSDPALLLDPIRFGLLRGTSTAWRGNTTAATAAVQRADDQLTALRSSVQIVPPSGPYLLAASDSPLLLNLDNQLPVQIDVRITLAPVAGLRTAPVEVVSLPAVSRRQVRVPTEVVRAGQFSVAAQLATPGGTPLGPRGAASRIQLRSTAYGTVTLALTGGAAGVLVLLSALRITRRVRAARAENAPTGE